MDFTSYAELAVRLVNTDARANGDPDWLGSPQAFSAFVADCPHLAGPVAFHDLDALRLLRDELAAIFTFAAEGNDAAAADRLNALLAQHPVHHVVARHDGLPWHLHLTEAGSVAERYAAGATFGLATVVVQFGANRLGVCAMASCPCAFIDASTNRSRRYCSDHCSTRATVTAFRARGSTPASSPPSTAAG